MSAVAKPAAKITLPASLRRDPRRAPKAQAELVTTAELRELAEWEKANTEAKKAATEAENNVIARRMALAKKVLGLTSDELKQLAPDEVARLFELRLQKGLWDFQRGAPFFAFEKYSSGRYPAWKSLFVAEVGEARAAQAQIDTPTTYSYRVKVEV